MIRIQRSLLLFTFLCLFAGVAAAEADIEVTAEPVNDTVAPGMNASVAEYEIGVRNGTVNVTDIAITRLPFDTAVAPSTAVIDGSCEISEQDAAGNCPWQNETVTVNVSVPAQEIPDTYTGDVAFVFDDRETREESLAVTVPEVVDWTVTDHRFNNSVNTGSDGVLGAFDVENTGNTRTAVDVNVTGNLSEYLIVDDVIDLYASRDRSVPVEYRITDDTPFGVYNGTIALTGDDSDRSEHVNLSVVFEDRERPEIEDLTVPDEIPATLDEEWLVIASDNLDVAAVTADVIRETTVTVGNTTQRVNKSVANVSFDPLEHTDTWRATVDETAERGQYYATIVVEDTAGNTVNRTEPFTVTELDAVTVLEDDVQFDGTAPDERLVVEVLDLDEAMPVDVELESFRELDSNDSMLVGIRETGDSSPELIEPGETTTVSEPGTYELVVETDREGRFRGELVYGVVEQHVNMSNTMFSGEFIDPECPSEDAYESGEYHYKFRYTGSDCVDGNLQYIVTAPGENCLGYADPSQCFNVEGADLGLIKERDNTVDLAIKLTAVSIGTAVFIVLLIAGFWWFDRRIWPYLDFELVKEAD